MASCLLYHGGNTGHGGALVKQTHAQGELQPLRSYYNMLREGCDCPHSGLEGEESVVELALGTRTGTQFNTVTQTETLFHTRSAGDAN
jgi:hypothetical protein